MVATSDFLQNDEEKVLTFFMDNSSYFEISTFLFKAPPSSRDGATLTFYRCEEGRANSMKYPSQHFNVGSTLFQRCGSTLKWRWFDIENETKSDVGFSTLHNVDTTSVSDVETTLKQRWYNFILTLLQCVLYISKSYIKTSQASDKYGFISKFYSAKYF